MLQNGYEIIPAEIQFFSPEVRMIFKERPFFESLAGGFAFSEGPVWMESEGCLYFTDFPHENIFRWDSQQGAVLFSSASNRAIGLAVDGSGQLISCESRLHRIAYVNAEGSRMIAGRYEGKALNSPNDVIVASNGDIYFTDPYSAAVNVSSAQGFQGVYRVSAEGRISLVCKTLNWPNGLALNQDETVLYINDTGENTIYAFDRNGAGQYGQQRELIQLDESYGEGACDGMKVDRWNNIWVTGPAGIWVLHPDGSKLAIIKCPEYVGNFCFGGADHDELFITASTHLYRMKLEQKIR